MASEILETTSIMEKNKDIRQGFRGQATERDQSENIQEGSTQDILEEVDIATREISAEAKALYFQNLLEKIFSYNNNMIEPDSEEQDFIFKIARRNATGLSEEEIANSYSYHILLETLKTLVSLNKEEGGVTFPDKIGREKIMRKTIESLNQKHPDSKVEFTPDLI